MIALSVIFGIFLNYDFFQNYERCAFPTKVQSKIVFSRRAYFFSLEENKARNAELDYERFDLADLGYFIFLSTAPRPYGRHYLVRFETYLLEFEFLRGVGKQFS